MNSKEFFDSVCELRRWQKEFAKTRRTEAERKVKKRNTFSYDRNTSFR